MSGATELAYLGFEASDLGAWERFATELLGLVLVERRADGALAFRMDDRAQRIVVHPGSEDDLAYAGFETGGATELETLVDSLRSGGIAVTEAKPGVAAARRAERVFQLEDPSGLPIELVASTEAAADAFHSDVVTSGFVTRGEGLGHIVIRANDAEVSEHFYRQLLGFRLSDRVHMQITPDFAIDITFLHVNSRHHTVAFASGAPLPKRIHHFMLEAASMDEVGLAYDRAIAAGVPIAQGLGRHANDRMFSFYVQTPSAFQIEFGWGGVKVDDASWEVKSYDRPSIWGHKPPTPPAANS